MYTIIVANSPDFDIAPFRIALQQANHIIAADGGANALHRGGLRPHILIGDLDSVTQATLDDYTAAGVAIIRYPAAKDETDLELALLHAVAQEATHIDVLGALGGRWDQTLSNIALLSLPELAGLRVRLLAPPQELYLVQQSAEVVGTPGDTVSLLPVGGPASGITISGFAYPLHEATLPYERSRGISNVLHAERGTIHLRQGHLLVIHTHTQTTPI
jgi:thiamine pyrophosphokinase